MGRAHVNDLDAEARIIQRLLHVRPGDFVGLNGFVARPHPGLLPRREGESFAGFLEYRAEAMAGAASSKRETDDGDSLSLGRGQG